MRASMCRFTQVFVRVFVRVYARAGVPAYIYTRGACIGLGLSFARRLGPYIGLTNDR